MRNRKYNQLKIGLDARSIGSRVCGVSRVTSCLIKSLSEIDRDNEYIVYTDSTVLDFNLGQNFRVCSTHCSKNNPAHDLKFYSILKKDELDLYHAMHSWFPEFIPNGIKTVVTIYDLFSFIDPQFFIKHKPFHKLFQLYFKYLTGRSVKKADAIITISNYCKEELIKHFPLSDQKLNVIYLAEGVDNSNRVINSNTGKRIIKSDYLFYLGNCRSYKNVGLLIEGFYIFLKKTEKPDLKLVIAGNDVYDSLENKAKKLGIAEKISFFINPSDDDIKNLYANSKAFIMPSRYEGFGIPVLEAMGFGVPVIISDADALLEVAGDAALVFNKNSPVELALAIEKILSDDKLRRKLIENGSKRAKEFTWKSSAMKLKSLYQRVLNN